MAARHHDYVARGLHLGPQDWNDIEVPGHAAGAVALMSGLLRRIDGLLAEPGSDDERLRLTADGDDRPAWAAVSYGFLEATHQCAEVGVLRDLYRERHRP